MTRTKKSKKANLDLANIEIDQDNVLLDGVKSVENSVSLKEKEIALQGQLDTPNVSPGD